MQRGWMLKEDGSSENQPFEKKQQTTTNKKPLLFSLKVNL